MMNKQKVKEAFRVENVGKMLEPFSRVLSSKVKMEVKFSTIPFVETEDGEIGYPGTIDRITVTLNFKKGHPTSMTFYQSLFPSRPDVTVNFNGYNVIKVIDEIAEYVLSYKKGINLLDLHESIKNLNEKRIDSKEIFLMWLETNKEENLDSIVNEKLVHLYKDEVLPWLDKNRYRMSYSSFFNATQAYLIANRLENKFAKKTFVQKAGQVKEIDPPKKDEKDWAEAKAASWDGKFAFLRNSLKALDKLNGILIYGAPGIGKSLTIKQMLSQSGLKSYPYKGSGVKDMSTLLELLFEVAYTDIEVLVLDDADSIWTSKDKREIMLQIMESGSDIPTIHVDGSNFTKINKRRKSPEYKKLLRDQGKKGSPKLIPLQFQVPFQVVIITNMKPEKLDRAMLDRVFTVNMELTKEEIVYGIGQNLDNFFPQIPYEVKSEVLEFLADNLKKINELSFRRFAKALAIRDIHEDTAMWHSFVLQELRV